MIERYTIKAAPSISQKELLKKLETMTEPTEIRKLQLLKVKLEILCEPEDFAKITGFLKSLSVK
jgi:hypothetical protein